MKRYVIDASVAIKWVVEEDGSAQALDLLKAVPLSAPDLLISECANILWKKVKRGELTKTEADLAARLYQGADIELLPTRHLMRDATRLAIELDHPASDCIYLTLALVKDWTFVSADQSLKRKLRQAKLTDLDNLMLPLEDVSVGDSS